MNCIDGFASHLVFLSAFEILPADGHASVPRAQTFPPTSPCSIELELPRSPSRLSPTEPAPENRPRRNDPRDYHQLDVPRITATPASLTRQNLRAIRTRRPQLLQPRIAQPVRAAPDPGHARDDTLDLQRMARHRTDQRMRKM